MDLETKSPDELAKMGVIDKVAWLHVRDCKLWMARTRGEKLFYNIGGKRKQKAGGIWESDHEALIREVREETGAELVPESIFLSRIFHDKTADGRIIRTKAFMADFLGMLEPCGEVVELSEFTSADLDLTTGMGQQIIDWLHSQNTID